MFHHCSNISSKIFSLYFKSFSSESSLFLWYSKGILNLWYMTLELIIFVWIWPQIFSHDFCIEFSFTKMSPLFEIKILLLLSDFYGTFLNTTTGNNNHNRLYTQKSDSELKIGKTLMRIYRSSVFEMCMFSAQNVRKLYQMVISRLINQSRPKKTITLSTEWCHSFNLDPILICQTVSNYCQSPSL